MKNRGIVCVPVIVAACVLASCASLQGIPEGLNTADRTNLADNKLTSALGVAQDLEVRYQTARDQNLEYAFWSNFSFIPLAAVAAGAIAFNAYKDLFAGVGIAAGTIAGLNVFINARANAKVYQSGINALDCITTKLRPYAKQSTSTIEASVNGLDAKVVIAQQVLAIDQSFKFTTAPELQEIKTNPLVVSNLAATQKLLTQAISDAQKASTDARNEIAAFGYVASFAADSIRQVNVVVSSKITQSDVSFSALEASIAALTKPPTPAPKATVPAAGGAGGAPALISTTPLADAAAASLAAAQDLATRTNQLSSETQQFGLTTQEKAVSECLKTI